MPDCVSTGVTHMCDPPAAVVGIRYRKRIKKKKKGGRLIEKRLYFSLGSFIELAQASHFVFPLPPQSVLVDNLEQSCVSEAFFSFFLPLSRPPNICFHAHHVVLMPCSKAASSVQLLESGNICHLLKLARSAFADLQRI